MTRVASRALGVFLLLYGLAAMFMAWWAYSITHQAYAQVRNVTTAIDRERAHAADVLEELSRSVGSRDGAPTGSGGESAAPTDQSVQVLRERVRALLGGRLGGAASSVAGTPAPQAAPGGDQSGGPLEALTRRSAQLADGWTRLGENPLQSGLLNQVELATNLVILWLAAHGLVSMIFAFRLLSRQPERIGVR